MNSKTGRVRGRFYLKTRRALAKSLAVVFLLGKLRIAAVKHVTEICCGETRTSLQQTFVDFKRGHGSGGIAVPSVAVYGRLYKVACS